MKKGTLFLFLALIFLSVPIKPIESLIQPSSSSPDLMIFNVLLNNTEPRNEDVVVFGALCDNMGDTDAVQWQINIYLDEKLFDTISVDVLSAGTLLHVTSDPWVATPGNHTVHFVLDAENHVDESNEDNNVMSKLFIVKLPVLNGEPTIVDIMGRPSQPTVGQMAIVQSEVRNIDIVPRDFTFIVQVKNPQGVVEYLSFITGSVNPGQSLTPGVSWTPQTSGEYLVETYVWKSFDEPIVLSESAYKEISVAS